MANFHHNNRNHRGRNHQNHEGRDNREGRENRERREGRDNREARESKERRENREVREVRDNRENRERRENRDNRERRENKDNREGQAISTFVLGTKELEGKNAEFQYDKGWYSITDIEGEEKNVIYKSKNAQEAYTKWNVYIGRKKERPQRAEKTE